MSGRESRSSDETRAVAERRDMRHFRPDPVDPGTLPRLLQAAYQAPSVGLTQPWRFVRITDCALRQRIHATVEEERRCTAAALDLRRDKFPQPKVEGVLECGELLVAALTNSVRQLHDLAQHRVRRQT